MHALDLTDHSVVTGRELESLAKSGVREIQLRKGVVLTSTAKDAIALFELKVQTVEASGAGPSGHGAYRPSYGKPQESVPEALFRSPEAQAIKEEIVHVGRKLWQREYVDGNGGNISYRLTEQYVLCTPTLTSKGDLTVDDIVMVDMEGRQVAGRAPRTSEILMHLAIYKAQPKARGCAHAHPPHATAYAITGRKPPTNIIPEAEIFIGVLGIAPYQTPGTQVFADEMLPLCRDHNTILLSNHGVVCWADTVTHAEWYMEVVDAYCRTLILAGQLGVPVTQIPCEQSRDLLAIKKRLDLPDPRHGGDACALSERPEVPGGIVACASAARCKDRKEATGCCGLPKCSDGAGGGRKAGARGPATEAIVQRITDEIMKKLG
jgi:L-fuculose-phosphate aldolase